MSVKISLFSKDTATTDFPAAHVLFQEGDEENAFYAVVAGEVDLIVHGVVVETVGAGGVFGEMALIERKPRSATACVRTDAKLVVIDEARFLYLVQQTPFFAVQLMRVMADRLRQANRRL